MDRRIEKNLHRSAKTYGIGALAAALIVIATVATSVVWAADAIIVSQRDRKFNPDRLTLERGTVIRIVNDDRVTHHIYVNAPGMNFDSGEQPIGTTVEVRFDRTGNFEILCAIHPTMHLRVTVK
jgi:plastocyanin